MEDIKPRLLLLLFDLHVDSFSISFPSVVSLRNVVDGCATTTGFCIRTKPETFVEVNIKIAEQSDNLTVLHIATNYFRQFNLRIYLYEEDGRWMETFGVLVERTKAEKHVIPNRNAPHTSTRASRISISYFKLPKREKNPFCLFHLPLETTHTKDDRIYTVASHLS